MKRVLLSIIFLLGIIILLALSSCNKENDIESLNIKHIPQKVEEVERERTPERKIKPQERLLEDNVLETIIQ